MSLKEEYLISDINQEIDTLLISAVVGEVSSFDNLMYSLHHTAAAITV